MGAINQSTGKEQSYGEIMTGQKIQIIVIEDQELARFGLMVGLPKHNSRFEVIGEAETGEKGLALIKRQQPDVAIVDLGLPGMSGIDVTQQIKRHHPQVKVMVLTVSVEEAHVLSAFDAGADSYCMKDNSVGLIGMALEQTYEGNHWIDPAIAKIVLRQYQVNLANQRQIQLSSSQETERTSKSTPASANGFATELTQWAQPIEVEPLTKREVQVLELMAEGLSNPQIGQKLFISAGTVKSHVGNILRKLCADTRTEATSRALKSQLFERYQGSAKHAS
jgi:NarL family two-component system response regulator LiaR